MTLPREARFDVRLGTVLTLLVLGGVAAAVGCAREGGERGSGPSRRADGAAGAGAVGAGGVGAGGVGAGGVGARGYDAGAMDGAVDADRLGARADGGQGDRSFDVPLVTDASRDVRDGGALSDARGASDAPAACFPEAGPAYYSVPGCSRWSYCFNPYRKIINPEWCDQYAKWCPYGAKPLYANRADCVARYDAYSGFCKGCATYYLCLAGKYYEQTGLHDLSQCARAAQTPSCSWPCPE